MKVLSDTWFMVVRQARNLMREPIWIALLLVQPMVWLLLYGQLFKRVTHLPGGGFGTTSYITFLAPAIVIMNAAFAGLSQGIALLVRKEATMIAIANFIGLPLFFLSSTLISIRQIPHWMQTAAKFNPVNWGVIAAREVVLPGTDWNSVGLHLALLFALSVATAAFATWTFRAYQRTI